MACTLVTWFVVLCESILWLDCVRLCDCIGVQHRSVSNCAFILPSVLGCLPHKFSLPTFFQTFIGLRFEQILFKVHGFDHCFEKMLLRDKWI